MKDKPKIIIRDGEFQEEDMQSLAKRLGVRLVGDVVTFTPEGWPDRDTGKIDSTG